MELCPYCFTPRGDKISCCGENHWTQATECENCGEYVLDGESCECEAKHE